MRHTPRLYVLLIALSGTNLAGCEQTVTVDRQSFQQLYDDDQTYTDVWYTGTDANYHHFILEHWTLTADGKDGHFDYRKLVQVPKDQMEINKPMDVTNDQEKWQLLRPT